MRTTAHQIILALLCCNNTAAAASLFHRSSLQRLPAVSSKPYNTQKQTHNHHYTKAFFQLVPRGGGGSDDDTNHNEDKEINVAKEYYYQELSEQLVQTEDDDVSLSDESYNYDVEGATSEETEESYQTPLPLDPILLDPTEIKVDEEEVDGMTKITILPKFFSSTHHFTSTVPSTMIHIAHVVLQAAKRSLLAGARAITQVERNVDDDHEDAAKKFVDGSSGVDDEEGPRRPVVRTLVGKTAFVLGEMYHAAKTTTSSSSLSSSIVSDVEVEDVEDDKSLKHHRHHRRRRKRRSEKSAAAAAAATRATTASPSHRRHHRHRNKARYTTSPTAVVCNGGGMEPHTSNNNKNALLNLAKRHKINLPTDDNANDDDSSSSGTNKSLPKKYDSILLNPQTSLSAALQKSNSDARFLICYISNNNTKKKGTSTSTSSKSDTIAYSSLLSPEVVKHINRRPLGKKQADGSTGSYYIWIMSGDENDDTMKKDVELAMKRLKVKPPTSSSGGSGSGSKKKKRKQDGPILAIIYPATTIDTSTGKLKVTPRLLAQHHCNPPPSSPEVMINWTNTIRKRHIREFTKLQHDRKEIQLLKERNEGYVTSMKEDKAREEKEELEARAKKEMEEKERLRKEKLEERRRELIEALPDEPGVGETGVITIALRFTDGSRDQRRFVADETSMNDVFNWVDAMHGLEREKIELSTMNGSKTFVYVEEEGDEEEEESGENMTLEEAGLGKMTALRVTEIVTDEDAADNEEDDDEQESDSSE